tara:strand:+ start:847 stop:1539 length:693 start_codon:yes stop_codon:yes gene_type:complete
MDIQNKIDLTKLINNTSIDLSGFISAILLSIILGFLIQQFYIRFSTTLSNKKEFSKIFVILSATTTIIITIVKSSLALSLGLVGALSIVRFRAAIKEPEELVYLFLLITVGLGCGALQFEVTLYGVLIVLLLIFVYSKINNNYKIKNLEKLNLSIIYDFKASSEIVQKHKDILLKKCVFVKLKSFSKTDNSTSLNFEIQLKNFDDLNNLIKQIHGKKIKVFIADDNVLTA